MTVKDGILKLVKSKGGVSFVEFSLEVPGFNGDLTFIDDDTNVVFWQGLSMEATNAINELLAEKEIIGQSTTPFVYLADGVIPKLPLAESLTRKYKKLHWIPMVFSTYEQLGKQRPKPH